MPPQIPQKVPKPRRPCGRPIVRMIKLKATPEQVAQAIFKAGRKPAMPISSSLGSFPYKSHHEA